MKSSTTLIKTRKKSLIVRKVTIEHIDVNFINRNMELSRTYLMTNLTHFQLLNTYYSAYFLVKHSCVKGQLKGMGREIKIGQNNHLDRIDLIVVICINYYLLGFQTDSITIWNAMLYRAQQNLCLFVCLWCILYISLSSQIANLFSKSRIENFSSSHIRRNSFCSCLMIRCPINNPSSFLNQYR